MIVNTTGQLGQPLGFRYQYHIAIQDIYPIYMEQGMQMGLSTNLELESFAKTIKSRLMDCFQPCSAFYD